MDDLQSTTTHQHWHPLDFQCPYCLYCPERGHSRKPKLRTEEEMPWIGVVWVCGDTDLFHPAVPDHLIKEILKEARSYDYKSFIFCTKNPERYFDFWEDFPHHSLLVITIESDIDHGWCTPPLQNRIDTTRKLAEYSHITDTIDRASGKHSHREICIAVQPIMTFTESFAETIINTQASQVSLGMEVLGLPDFPSPDLDTVASLAKTLSHHMMVSIDGARVFEDTHLTEWPNKEDRLAVGASKRRIMNRALDV